LILLVGGRRIELPTFCVSIRKLAHFLIQQSRQSLDNAGFLIIMICVFYLFYPFFAGTTGTNRAPIQKAGHLPGSIFQTFATHPGTPRTIPGQKALSQDGTGIPGWPPIRSGSGSSFLLLPAGTARQVLVFRPCPGRQAVMYGGGFLAGPPPAK